LPETTNAMNEHPLPRPAAAPVLRGVAVIACGATLLALAACTTPPPPAESAVVEPPASLAPPPGTRRLGGRCTIVGEVLFCD
jgi:hypothetical protein